jgi:hypothetical protein
MSERGIVFRRIFTSIAVACAALPVLAVGPSAWADTVPIPFDTNCTFSYGVSLTNYGQSQVVIESYGGHTDCSGVVYSIDAQSRLDTASGNTVQYGNEHFGQFVDNEPSHGGPYGPVSDASAWRSHFLTTVYLNNQTWKVGTVPQQCSTYDGNHGLTCDFMLAFSAAQGATPVTYTLESIGVAT